MSRTISVFSSPNINDIAEDGTSHGKSSLSRDTQDRRNGEFLHGYLSRSEQSHSIADLPCALPTIPVYAFFQMFTRFRRRTSVTPGFQQLRGYCSCRVIALYPVTLPGFVSHASYPSLCPAQRSHCYCHLSMCPYVFPTGSWKPDTP